MTFSAATELLRLDCGEPRQAIRQLQFAHLAAVVDVQEVQDVETEEGRIG